MCMRAVKSRSLLAFRPALELLRTQRMSVQTLRVADAHYAGYRLTAPRSRPKSVRRHST